MLQQSQPSTGNSVILDESPRVLSICCNNLQLKHDSTTLAPPGTCGM